MTLYAKADCGLCEAAEAVLRKLQREIHFSLDVVDIESDTRLFDRYWHRVPVVAVDGKEVAEALIEARRLRALIGS